MSENKADKAENQNINQAELDALLAGTNMDHDISAETPDEGMKTAQELNKDASMNIDQAELEALLASMGEDEIFSDKHPQPQTKSAAPQNDKVLTQEEIDAMLAALGG